MTPRIRHSNVPPDREEGSSAPVDAANLELALTGVLFSQYRAGSLINLAVTLTLYGLLEIKLGGLLPLGWLLFAMLTLGLREGLFLYTRKQFGDTSPDKRCRHLFTLGSTLQAATWSSLGFILLPQQDLVYQLILLCILVGMSGGSVIHLSASRLTYGLYAVTLLLPNALILLSIDSPQLRVAGGIGLIYLFAMLHASYRTNLSLRKSLALAFDKQDLVNHLEEARNDLEMHRLQLETEVIQRTAELQRSNDSLRREITERQQAEAAARKSERQLRTLTDMLPEAVFEMTTDGVLTYLNQRGSELLQVTPDDGERPVRVLDFFSASSRATAAESFRQVFEQRKVVRNEVAFTTADGSELPVLLVLAPIVDDGHCAGGRGIAVNLTRVKELEAQLLQSQKLDAIGTLAGGIAHDFNNILMAILGHSDLAALDPATTPKTRERLSIIADAVTRGKNLVDQILTFSRRSNHQYQPVDMNRLIEECAKLLRASIPATIATEFKTCPTACHVYGDPSQLHQLIINLCTNAYQEMQDRPGLLRVTLTCPDCGEESPHAGFPEEAGSSIILSVSDTGPGIEPSVLPRIFEPFFTTKAPDQGTGMGLAVVHGIVQAHGGNITVESLPGQGTTFTVWLPRHVPATTKPADADSALGADGSRILFVDDEPQLTDIAEELLPELGFLVTTFNNPLQAMEAFQAAPDRFDLLVTDQTMANMTGVSLSEQLRRIRPRLPVIIYSGNLNFIGSLPSNPDAVTLTLSKPLRMQELCEAIHSALAPPSAS